MCAEASRPPPPAEGAKDNRMKRETIEISVKLEKKLGEDGSYVTLFTIESLETIDDKLFEKNDKEIDPGYHRFSEIWRKRGLEIYQSILENRAKVFRDNGHVYLVQSGSTSIVYGCFSNRLKAENFIKDSQNMEIRECEVA